MTEGEVSWCSIAPFDLASVLFDIIINCFLVADWFLFSMFLHVCNSFNSIFLMTKVLYLLSFETSKFPFSDIIAYTLIFSV